jgi:hypothetical protein
MIISEVNFEAILLPLVEYVGNWYQGGIMKNYLFVSTLSMGDFIYFNSFFKFVDFIKNPVWPCSE